MTVSLLEGRLGGSVQTPTGTFGLVCTVCAVLYACGGSPAPVDTTRTFDDTRAVASSVAESRDEIERRASLREQLEPAIAAVWEERDSFGESYITDEGGRWRLVIPFVEAGGSEVSRQRVALLIPPDAPVEWRTARYSYAELIRITDEMMANLSPEDGIHGFGPNAKLNRVEILMTQRNQQVESRLRARFGDAIVFTTAAAPSPI